MPRLQSAYDVGDEIVLQAAIVIAAGSVYEGIVAVMVASTQLAVVPASYAHYLTVPVPLSAESDFKAEQYVAY